MSHVGDQPFNFEFRSCRTEKWGINFMPQKIQTGISHDGSKNNISLCLICFSLGGMNEQLNRLTVWPAEFSAVYFVTLPQKEKNSLTSFRGINLGYLVSTSTGSLWFKTIIWTQIRTNLTLSYRVLLIQISTDPEFDVSFGQEYNTNSWSDKHCDK